MKFLCAALVEATPPLHRATPHHPPAQAMTRTTRALVEVAEKSGIGGMKHFPPLFCMFDELLRGTFVSLLKVYAIPMIKTELNCAGF
jgi:hypothetical protein